MCTIWGALPKLNHARMGCHADKSREIEDATNCSLLDVLLFDSRSFLHWETSTRSSGSRTETFCWLDGTYILMTGERIWITFVNFFQNEGWLFVQKSREFPFNTNVTQLWCLARFPIIKENPESLPGIASHILRIRPGCYRHKCSTTESALQLRM